jgi:hypothetical protein
MPKPTTNPSQIARIQGEIDRLYDVAFSRPRQYRTGIGRRIARLERQIAV